MDKKNKVLMVGLGEILWDVLPQGKQLGGAPANFAYHATQLGNRGVVVSCVGRDENGTEILQVLEKKGVQHLIAMSDAYPTGIVSVVMGERGIPSYTIHEDAAWDHLSLTEDHVELARRADVVCYGTLAHRTGESAAAIKEFLSYTTPACIRLFDINLRQNYYDKGTILALLQRASILKLNDEELKIIEKYFQLSGDETALLEKLCKEFDLDLVILTKGQQGSRLFSPRLGDSQYKGEEVKVADTVGAGDSFSAAVATGLCRNWPLARIHPFADRVAAYVCTRSGATPELPPLEILLDETSLRR